MRKTVCDPPKQFNEFSHEIGVRVLKSQAMMEPWNAHSLTEKLVRQAGSGRFVRCRARPGQTINGRRRDMVRYIKMGEEEGITRSHMTIRNVRQSDELPLRVW